MSRIPLRLRLTLPFAVGMAALLAAMGLFIYTRVGGALMSSVDQSLRTQAEEVIAHVDRAGVPDRDRVDAPQIAQVVTAQGAVITSTPPGLRPILTSRQLETVLGGRRVWLSESIPGLDQDWRIVAVPATVHGSGAVAVFARSLEPREEALQRVVREFLIGGSAALLVAILAGYGLAAAALRPVETMRRRVAAITASTTEQRLPVPPARDELARLAATLNDMLARIEAAVEHERRFIDDASHELRTPLALLKTELEIALRRRRSREELERALHAAAADTEELVRLAEDLLLVARADQGELPIRPELLSARDVLEEVADRFGGDAEARGRPLTVAASADATVDADPARLKQALGNLVRNALVHGSGPVELDVRTSADEVEFHVRDSGRGFSEEFRAHAFDRFATADSSRTSAGAGLGLAIVDLIARPRGGRADVRNRDAGGADAVLILPRAPLSPSPGFRPRHAVRNS